MTVHIATPHRPLITRTHMLALSLLAVGILLLVASYLAPGHVGVTSTPGASALEAPVSQRLEPLAQTPRSDCAVTGDLAGDANPAEIAAAMCAGHAR